jgi:hypothetical protein
MATNRIYHYPVWVRLWHAVNALTFILLLITGLSLHYSSAESSLIPFQVSVAIHNVCAIILTFSYGVFVLGNMFTRNGDYYRKWRKNLWPKLWKQFHFYAIGIFRGGPASLPNHQETEVQSPAESILCFCHVPGHAFIDCFRICTHVFPKRYRIPYLISADSSFMMCSM